MKRLSIVFMAILACCTVFVHGSTADIVDQLNDVGIDGGLVVVLGCPDEEPLLRLETGAVIQYLDTDLGKVAKMRRRIMAKGAYGRVSADAFDGNKLPYIDNLVNSVVLSSSKLAVDSEEIERVLAPGGICISRVPATEQRTLVRKPVPVDYDDWTHQLYNASNIGISRDKAVAPPETMQWLAGPSFTRDHGYDKGTAPAIRLVLAGNGRLYYIIDETNSSNMSIDCNWYLLARDAYSGIELWKIPLRPDYARKLEQVWRMMVADTEHGGRVYVAFGEGEPISQIAGATGKVLRNYPGSESATEFVKDGALLLVVKGTSMIQAYHAETGEKLWIWEPDEGDPIFPLTMAAADGVVAVKTDHAIFCFAQKDGKLKWKKELQPTKVLKRPKYAHEKLIIHDGVVLASYAGEDAGVLYRDNTEYLGLHPRVKDYRGMMAALSMKDGQTLWTAPYLPSIDDGSPGEIYIHDGKVLLGPDFSMSRELKTGKEFQGENIIEGLWTTGHHYRCYPGKATDGYIITAKRGVEMISIGDDNHARADWVRGTCRVGVTPANGLLYCPPHSCGCYWEAKLWGFWALAGSQAKVSSVQCKDARLERGPAFARASVGALSPYTASIGHGKAVLDKTAAKLAMGNDWFTYRGNNERAGSTDATLPTDLREVWKSDVPGRPSAVTSADDKVFVASVDQHAIFALDVKSGKRLWSFTASARVDSPPTIVRVPKSNPETRTPEARHALCLFGSRDGCVYCLWADTGELVWRFRAAPSIEQSVAYEQLESVWPCFGAVLVEDNIAYVSAGRSSYLDGGISLYGLDVQTGNIVCSRVLEDEHPGYTEPPENAKDLEQRISQNWFDYKTTMEPDEADSFTMRGALTDVMTSDGHSIFMRQMRFDEQLRPIAEKHQHLFSTSSLLDGYEFNRMYWVLGTGDFKRTPVAYPWLVWKSMKVPFGLMMSFDDRTVWSVRMMTPGRFQGAYALVSEQRPSPDDPVTREADFQKSRNDGARPNVNWQVNILFRPRAIIRAGDVIVIGGHPIDDRSKGLLQLVSSTTGKTIKEIALPAAPSWDGMAVASGRLFVPMVDGEVACFE